MASTDTTDSDTTISADSDTMIAGFPRLAVLTFLTCLEGARLRHRMFEFKYGDIALLAGLPETIITDQTLLKAGLIVWREGQGWVVTDEGRVLLEAAG